MVFKQAIPLLHTLHKKWGRPPGMFGTRRVNRVAGQAGRSAPLDLAGLVFEHGFEAGDLALELALAGDHHEDVDHEDQPGYDEAVAEELIVALKACNLAEDGVIGRL
jgi:hypothetical protein